VAKKMENDFNTQEEIEIKLELSVNSASVLSKWLLDNADFVAETFQSERYLDRSDNSLFFSDKFGKLNVDTYLRVRFSNIGSSVCLKKVHRDLNSDRVYCSEFETKVEDGDQLLEILYNSGFMPKIFFEKNRKTYVYADFEIALDEIPQLGKFVEIEVKNRKFKDIKDEFLRIERLLKDIGINECKEHKDGYVYMLLNK
jgi:predicted adenylyl cyclase CyaB